MAPRVTIPDLPVQSVLDDADLLVVQDDTTTKRMTVGLLTANTTAAVAAHTATVADAHDASAISAEPNVAPMDGTNVQLQLAQAAAAIDVAGSSGADAISLLGIHITDVSEAHAASTISVTPIPFRTGTDVQAVLEEISAIVGDGEMIEVGPTPPPDTSWLWADTTDDGDGGGGGSGSVEDTIDMVVAALIAGNNIDITHDDVFNTITIDVETLTSADVGLGNVDNTSDVNKPVSTATQTVLDAKADGDDLVAHVDDTVDAHDASAISFVPTGTIAATNVQAAIAEVASEAAAGGITTEDAVDAVGAAFAAGSHTNVTVTYNDAANSISLASSATVTDAELLAIAGLTSAADSVPYFTGSGTAALATVTSAARTVLDDTTVAAMLTTLGGLSSATAATTYAPIRRSIVADTTTGFAPVVGTHLNTMVTLSNASAITVTLPSNATSAFTIGDEVDFLWLGVGQPTFVAGSSATVNGTPGLKLRAQYSACTAKKIATNDWVLIGDLSA